AMGYGLLASPPDEKYGPRSLSHHWLASWIDHLAYHPSAAVEDLVNCHGFPSEQLNHSAPH
ncbi:MAG: hypothetical protein ACRDJK_13905, partial [Actinomycetota bacterium]